MCLFGWVGLFESFVGIGVENVCLKEIKVSIIIWYLFDKIWWKDVLEYYD